MVEPFTPDPSPDQLLSQIETDLASRSTPWTRQDRAHRKAMGNGLIQYTLSSRS